MGKQPPPASKKPSAKKLRPPTVPPPGPDDFPSQFARYFFGVLTLIILYYSYLIIKPFLVEIFLGLVFFFVSKPLYNLVLRLCFGLRSLASALTCLLLALFIILPILTLASIIAGQALDIYNLINQGLHSGTLWPHLADKLAFVQEYARNLNLPLNLENLRLEQLIQTALVTASQFIYDNAIGLVKGFTTVILSLLLILFVTFFLFLEGDAFIQAIKELSPLEPVHNEEILGDVENTIKATLRGTVIVAFIQGVLGGVGFWLFGVPKAAFWGTVMIPASVIPVVGAALIWLPGALFLFFQGYSGASLGLILWSAIVIGSVDNILKPYLMKGARYTPTVFTLFAIMGGISYFGTVGFIMGPLILSFLLSVLSIYRHTILLATRPAACGVAPPRPKPESGPEPAPEKEESRGS
ncbi:MAG: AI-2E family transporter [Desulfobacca sp.]|uniref:AI-2E family transporter n=1 Tax=Desulfobacca sp. TaxID=2067990 RepID=UPI004048F268